MVQSIKNIFAAIIVSVSVYLAWTTILPKYDYTSALKTETEKRADILTVRQGIFKRNVELQNAYQQRYSEFKRLSLIIPASKSLPELISTIESMASAAGVIIAELKIEGGSGVDTFNVINIEVSAEASYDSILNFLGFLEQNIRLMDVNFVSIGSAPGESGFLTFEVKAKIYHLNPTTGEKEESDLPGFNE